jgi:hypothetical protein
MKIGSLVFFCLAAQQIPAQSEPGTVSRFMWSIASPGVQSQARMSLSTTSTRGSFGAVLMAVGYLAAGRLLWVAIS